MSSYSTHMFVENGNVGEILDRVKKFCKKNVKIKGPVLCGFHQQKGHDFLVFNILAEYDIHDQGILKAEKIVEDCFRDSFVCIIRDADDETVVKAWDCAELIYEFDLDVRKQWIAKGYEKRFQIFDDPYFYDLASLGLDWNDDWDKIESMFEELYGEPEPDYFKMILKKLFPSQMEVLEANPWGWDIVLHKMDWYLVFEDGKVNKAAERISDRLCDVYDDLSEWYP